MTQTLEDAQTLLITKWGSLNTAASPSKLPEGQSPDNQNVWMDEKPGSLVTAKGYSKLGVTPSGNPATLLLDYFKTSDGSQTVIVSDGQTVWKTIDYVNFSTIKTGLSPYFQLRGAVIRGKLWLTNGSDPVMTYDGTSLTVLDGSGSTPNVPLAKYIAYHDERVWVYGFSGDLSSLRFSDLADSSGTEIEPDAAAAWPTDNEVQVSEGDDDIGTGLFLYRGYLYAAKSFSIWRIVGYDEYTYTRVKTKSSTGTRFQESVAVVDNLVNFIGVDGLYSFNGEESERISDIIDPASSAPGIFAFRNLQQPLLNNKFWNVSATADWELGTIPRGFDTTNDRLAHRGVDYSQSAWAAGTKTRVTSDDNPGFLQLSVASLAAGAIVSVGKNASLVNGAGFQVFGNPAYITDGSTALQAGLLVNTGAFSNIAFQVDLGGADSLSSVTIRDWYADQNADFFVRNALIRVSLDGNTWGNVASVTIPSLTAGAYYGILGSGSSSRSIAEHDETFVFQTVSARYVQFYLETTGAAHVIRELIIHRAGFEADGKFVSRAIDYGNAPATFGNLAASIVENGMTYQFFTQSSADGSSWDSEVNVSNGAAIASTVRRYLRWGIYMFSSTQASTPVLEKVFVGATYLSPIHNTGGSIFQWGAFQLAVNKAGQTVNAYYRAGTDAAGVAAASWIPIVSGAVPGTAVTNSSIQIRLEFSTTDANFSGVVTSYAVNWIVGTANGVNTLQNVASAVWLNRYWLSAATLGATANDIVLVRGKASLGSLWHKKDFSILSFARFQDYFIGGSSTDGSIYRMETGYSKNGAALDAFFETGDFSKGNFQMKGSELIVVGDRTGPYTVSIGVSTDGGISYTERTIDLTRATTATALEFKKLLNVAFMSNQVRLRIRNNAADQPFSIDDIELLYRLQPFRGDIG